MLRMETAHDPGGETCVTLGIWEALERGGVLVLRVTGISLPPKTFSVFKTCAHRQLSRCKRGRLVPPSQSCPRICRTLQVRYRLKGVKTEAGNVCAGKGHGAAERWGFPLG